MNLPKTEEELKEFCVELINSRFIGRTITSVCYDKWLSERNKPNLYDGLTKEQWDVAIKDELICEFWDDADSCLGKITKIYDETFAEFPFRSLDNDVWKHCRIHRSQPQFNTGTKPDWLDDAQLIVYKLENGRKIKRNANAVNWDIHARDPIIRWQVVSV